MSRRIVQCARTIGAGYGVSGPTLQLEAAFQELGCVCERFSLEDLHIRTEAMPGGSPWLALLRFWRDVFLFSTLGSLVLWWRFGRRRQPGTVVICQVDALYGDLFVVRSLHKAFLETRPDRTLMLLRNPLHALVLARDYLRFKGKVHRHFVALSEANKQDLIRLYAVAPERITVIPNGVDLSRFRPRPEVRRRLRRSLGLPDHDLVAIFAGHEFERKGLRVLLEALRLRRADGSCLTLLVAGRDSAKSLQAEFSDLANWVHYLGNRPDLENYYACADLFVMPAAFDVSPLVGPEALASGLPILVTPVGGVLEYLQDGRNGFFIQRDPQDIAQRLRRLEEDRELLHRLSSEARASVADRDWSVVARRFLELLERLEQGATVRF